MKLFIDTADLGEIRTASEWGIIDGVTTNPTLIARAGRPFRAVIDDILALIDGDISAEVISTDTAGMVREAREIATWGPNVVVKIPLTDQGIAAVAQVSTIKQSYQEKLTSAPAGEKERITSEANDAMARAVTDQGLSVEEYNSIIKVAQNDPQIRQKILQRVKTK